MHKLFKPAVTRLALFFCAEPVIASLIKVEFHWPTGCSPTLHQPKALIAEQRIVCCKRHEDGRGVGRRLPGNHLTIEETAKVGTRIGTICKDDISRGNRTG
jgi:hypothetical protein